jgi:hypothetical protein
MKILICLSLSLLSYSLLASTTDKTTNPSVARNVQEVQNEIRNLRSELGYSSSSYDNQRSARACIILSSLTDQLQNAITAINANDRSQSRVLYALALAQADLQLARNSLCQSGYSPSAQQITVYLQKVDSDLQTVLGEL